MKNLNTNAEIFLDFLVAEGRKDLDGSNAKIDIQDYARHRDMLLKAYNTMCKEEYNNEDYIFNADSNEDMIELLKQNHSIWEISNALFGEFPYCTLVWNAEKQKEIIKPLDAVSVEEILRSNIRDIMTCVLLYSPNVDTYMEVYKEYVSNRCEEY